MFYVFFFMLKSRINSLKNQNQLLKLSWHYVLGILLFLLFFNFFFFERYPIYALLFHSFRTWLNEIDSKITLTKLRRKNSLIFFVFVAKWSSITHSRAWFNLTKEWKYVSHDYFIPSSKWIFKLILIFIKQETRMYKYLLLLQFFFLKRILFQSFKKSCLTWT